MSDGAELLIFASEKEEESRLFDRWVNGAQYQMGFDEFKRSLTRPQLNNEKEVLDDVEHILTSWEAENGNF